MNCVLVLAQAHTSKIESHTIDRHVGLHVISGNQHSGHVKRKESVSTFVAIRIFWHSESLFKICYLTYYKIGLQDTLQCISSL